MMSKLNALVFAATILLTCPFLCLAQQQKSVIEVPMLSRGAMPAVEVMVNGKGKFLFAIDTGAQGMARVDSTLVERLGLQITGKLNASDGSGQNARSLDIVKLDSISIGDVQFRDVEALSRNYNTSPAMPHIDGVLGFELFKDYLLTLDFPAQRVRLERGELPKADGVEVVSFENPRGVPTVELSVGNMKVKAHIDSGNNIGQFVLPTAIVEKMSMASTPVTVGRARTVSSEVEIKEVRLKDSLRLGRYEFAEPTVTFPAISEYANIGSKTLRAFALTFDQKNKRVRLLQKAEANKANVAKTEIPKLTDSALNAYTGKYGENKMISVQDGALYYQRIGGRGGRLIALSKDIYNLNDDARLTFLRDAKGNVTELLIEWNDGHKDQLKRTQ